MFGALFYTLAAWLSTSAAFVGIPVYFALRRDVRLAEAQGLPNARAIATRRFFVPVAPQVSDAIAGKEAWLEWWSSSRQKRAVRVIAIDANAIALDNGLVFRPQRASRAFASGAGAATGAVFDASGGEVGAALLVFT